MPSAVVDSASLAIRGLAIVGGLAAGVVVGSLLRQGILDATAWAGELTDSVEDALSLDLDLGSNLDFGPGGIGVDLGIGG
jgi:hypothetical protein